MTDEKRRHMTIYFADESELKEFQGNIETVGAYLENLGYNVRNPRQPKLYSASAIIRHVVRSAAGDIGDTRVFTKEDQP